MRLALTLIENALRNTSPEVFDAQGDHQHIIHLPDNRDEVWDDLDWTDNIKNGAPGDRFRVPWDLGVYKGPPDDPELFEHFLY